MGSYVIVMSMKVYAQVGGEVYILMVSEVP